MHRHVVQRNMPLGGELPAQELEIISQRLCGVFQDGRMRQKIGGEASTTSK